MSNYFISYDLYAPGQDYDAIAAAIENLEGTCAKVHLSLYYLSSHLSEDQVYTSIHAACDHNDKFMVITASKAKWNRLSPDASSLIQQNWER